VLILALVSWIGFGLADRVRNTLAALGVGLRPIRDPGDGAPHLAPDLGTAAAVRQRDRPDRTGGTMPSATTVAASRHALAASVSTASR
jgi:hypothetical protein